MATYTSNYGLHQWAAEDNFLRTDFNTDFSKIDAAIKGVSDAAASQAWAVDIKAQRALDALEPVSYNVYQLMLQNCYEGKYTGYKKALIFDGFLDQSQISSLSGLTLIPAQRCLLLDGVGQSSASYNFGTAIGSYIGPSQSTSATWTATGNGTLTAVRIYLQGSATLSVYNQAGTLLASAQATGSGGAASFNLTVSIQAGQTYRLTLKNNNASGSMVIQCQDTGVSALGFSLSITPLKTTSGTMTSVSFAPGSWSKALAWVRHSGGTAGLSLGAYSMTAGTSRTVQNLEGVSCTERAFSRNSSGSGSVQVKLSASVSSGSVCRIYDYGVVLL